MKKKILLSLAIVAILVCVFAISVSAQDRESISYTDINGVTHNVPVVKYDDATAESVASKLGNNATVQARFIDNGAYTILKASDGSLTAYPSWYIIEPSGNNADYVAISEIEYGYVNEKSGKSYNKGAILYIEFPSGMTAVRNNGVFGMRNNGNPYETNVTDFYIPATVHSIESNSFAHMPFLKNVYFEAGNQIKEIPGYTFADSSVEYIQFENLTELVSVDGCSKCELKGKLDLSKTKLKTIKEGAFQYCENISEIYLPDTVERIENMAFSEMGNACLASPYLPSSLTFVGKRFFAYNNNLLDTYIFPEGVKSIGDEPFQDSCVAGGPTGKKLNLVFLGEVTGVIYLNGNGHQKHAEEVTVYFAKNTLSQYNSNGFYVKPSGSSYTDVARAIRVVFCNANNSAELIYLTNTNGSAWEVGEFVMDGHTHFGSHTVVENTCGKDGSETISCIVCDKDIVTALEATGNHSYENGICTVCGHSLCPGGGNHDMKPTVVYENGFLNAGKIVSKCQNEGCDHEVKESDLDAIFTFKGYSAKIDGNKITVGYLVNQNALATYEQITGTSLNYGIVACVASAESNSPITVNEGKLTVNEKTIMVKIDSAYTAFEFILNGFTSEQYDIALVMCAYVFDGESVNYICSCNGIAGQYEYAYSVTFNGEATE